MAPIIVARSVSQDSTESSSVHLKTTDIVVGSSTTRALCSPPSKIKENETSRKDKVDNQSAEEPAKNSVSDSNKLAHQSSNLFVDEDELQGDTTESLVSRGLLSIDIECQNHADGSTMQISTSRKERFGTFSPSGSGELEEVSLSTTSPLSDNPTHLSNLGAALNYSLSIHGFDQRQIDADEELARSLQAEEDKKQQQQRRKPRRGSTLECWFEDSIHQLGKRINETAVDFLGGK